MKAWVTYFRERILLIPFFVVAVGIALSGMLIGQGRFTLFPFLISFIGIALVFVILRIDNDLKDYEKDRIVFPNRPLPRGLLKRVEAARFLRYLWIIAVAYALMILLLLPWKVGITFGASVLYLWVITTKDWLNLVGRLVLRQGIVVPLAFFAVAIGHPYSWIEEYSMAYALILFGAFATNEICRKLDPLSHPILLGLTHYYGFKLTFLVALGMLLISGIGAFLLDVQMILWPCECAVLFALLLLFKAPRRFQLAETAAYLSLMIHAWAGVCQNLNYSL